MTSRVFCYQQAKFAAAHKHQSHKEEKARLTLEVETAKTAVGTERAAAAKAKLAADAANATALKAQSAAAAAKAEASKTRTVSDAARCVYFLILVWTIRVLTSCFVTTEPRRWRRLKTREPSPPPPRRRLSSRSPMPRLPSKRLTARPRRRQRRTARCAASRKPLQKPFLKWKPTQKQKSTPPIEKRRKPWPEPPRSSTNDGRSRRRLRNPKRRSRKSKRRLRAPKRRCTKRSTPTSPSEPPTPRNTPKR